VDPNPYSIASLDPNSKFNTDSGFGSKGAKMIIFKSELKPKNVILILSILHVHCAYYQKIDKDWLTIQKKLKLISAKFSVYLKLLSLLKIYFMLWCLMSLSVLSHKFSPLPRPDKSNRDLPAYNF